MVDQYMRLTSRRFVDRALTEKKGDRFLMKEVSLRASGLLWWGWAFLMLVSITRGWLMPLHSGFFLDETGTYYLISGTWHQFLERMSLTIQSPVYCALLWTIFHAVGRNEMILRLPSILAMAMAAYCVYSFSREAAGPGTGKLAMLIFVSLPDVAHLSFLARPYSLLIAVTAASAFFFQRWLKTQARTAGAGCILCLVLAFYSQPTSGLMAVVYSVVILRQTMVGEIRFQWAEIGVGTALLALLSAPILPYYFAAVRQASTYSYADSPSWIDLLNARTVSEPLTCLFFGICVALFFFRRLEWQPLRIGHTLGVFLTVWIIAPIFGLFIIAKFTPAKLFVFHYYAFTLPAAAILMGLLVSLLKYEGQRLAVMSILVLLLLYRSWSIELWPVYDPHEDWRTTSQTLLSRGYPPETPVFLRSGFTEAKVPDRLLKRQYRDFILAPAFAYSFPGVVRALPDFPEQKHDKYMLDLTADLSGKEYFVVVGDNKRWQEWFTKKFMNSFTVAELSTAQPKGVPILEFRRAAPISVSR
jgi:Dolichyl-phosphate-mannose-protein mannosyltransferase